MKKITTIIIATIFSVIMIGQAFAGWCQLKGTTKWFFDDNGILAANEWKWIGGKCYCFDADGVMYSNTTTPDGYRVNTNGEWVVEGQIQQQDTSGVITNGGTGTATGRKLAKNITSKTGVSDVSKYTLNNEEYKNLLKIAKDGSLTASCGKYTTLKITAALKKYMEENEYYLSVYINGELDDEYEFDSTNLRTINVEFEENSTVKLVWNCKVGENVEDKSSITTSLYIIDGVFEK